MIKLLLVDDHTIFREGIGTLLDMEEDMKVVGQTSRGEEVLPLVSRCRPDVVLLDVTMPDVNGIELCRQIKHRWPHINVLMLSASDSDNLIAAALTAGASGYVVKTIDHERLAAGIRAIWRGEMLLSPTVAAKVVQQLNRGAVEKAKEQRQGGDPLQSLTPREREIFLLAAQNHTNMEIARQLVVSDTTIKTHLRNISHKLNLNGKAEIRALAIRLGLIPSD